MATEFVMLEYVMSTLVSNPVSISRRPSYEI